MAFAMLAVFATLVTLIATVLVLAAFGLGKALSLVLPFSVFEASLFSMLALWPGSGLVAHRDVRPERRHPTCPAHEQDDDDEVEEESFDKELDEGERVAWAAPLRPVISPPQIGRNPYVLAGAGGSTDAAARRVARAQRRRGSEGHAAGLTADNRRPAHRQSWRSRETQEMLSGYQFAMLTVPVRK